MPGPGDWLSHHLVYHGSRDRLLVELVRPLVGALWRDEAIDRFFFVRYALGGPHLRLRLRCRAGRREEAAARLTAAAAAFFARRPAETALDEEAIRRQNRRLLANDPGGAGDEELIYPNNTLIELPFALEVERYGGEELLGVTLDLFTVSSLHAVAAVAARDGRLKEEGLALAMDDLAALAAGLAAGGEEYLDLLQYAVVWSKGDGALFTQRGDEAYARRPEAYRRVVRGKLAAPAAGPRLQEAARHLRREVAGAAAPVRRRIAVGQLHMTANRLGLTNAEEIYLGRMLWRSAEDLRDAEPALWARGFPPPDAAAGSIEEMIPAAFASALAGAGDGGERREPEVSRARPARA